MENKDSDFMATLFISAAGSSTYNADQTEAKCELGQGEVRKSVFVVCLRENVPQLSKVSLPVFIQQQQDMEQVGHHSK